MCILTKTSISILNSKQKKTLYPRSPDYDLLTPKIFPLTRLQHNIPKSWENVWFTFLIPTVSYTMYIGSAFVKHFYLGCNVVIQLLFFYLTSDFIGLKYYSLREFSESKNQCIFIIWSCMTYDSSSIPFAIFVTFIRDAFSIDLLVQNFTES